MKLLHVTIQTKFFAEEVDFFEKYVSLSIIKDMRPFGKNMLFLADQEGDTEIEIIEKTDALDAGNDNLSIGFHSENIEELREILLQDGFTPSEFVTPMPSVKFFFVVDPAGVKIQFM